MVINIQDDILKLQALGVLDALLVDKTIKRHIMWATNAYSPFGAQYGRNEEIGSELITGRNSDVIKTRARKASEHQTERTRQRGEVFTPLWVCKKMCDYADERWNSNAGWQKYVDARVLEITCGEAPFLVSRYDAETGEAISVQERIGLLDRKLQMVNENIQEKDEWLKWAVRAFWATYGYEFQGDNVLIARVNLIMTFEEYYFDRWKRKPSMAEYQKIANIVAWNIWQMDGLTGTIPFATAEEEFQQFSLFGMFAEEKDSCEENTQPRCRVFNWLSGGSIEYLSLPAGGKRAMKFDYIIGNPPYQDETIGENKTFAPPIYHLFLDAAYEVSDKVEMIHPARFLFDAGSTPKAWNRKMLHDEHLRVLFYDAISSNVFPNTDIKGGIAITYHDKGQDFGAIEHFIVFDELRSILNKVQDHTTQSLSSIIYSSESYKFTDIMHQENPSVERLLSAGHKYDLKTSVLENLNGIVFFDVKPADNEYVQVLGLVKGKRVSKWIHRKYLKGAENFEAYKVFVPAANGSGALGEVLSTPVIGQPVIGHTQTFISIGNFKSEYEALSCIKYIKSKFCRTMLGILKITQHNPAPKWKYVPLQDFTEQSDLDWTGSVKSVDRQLYAKYGLDEKEIEFIETHVKEME